MQGKHCDAIPGDTGKKTKRALEGSELRKGNRGLSTNGYRTRKETNIITSEGVVP